MVSGSAVSSSAVIGAPLGVCVNCAAPIAKGLHAAGTRLETTLATMISSPTMNMIVLTMVFALMPWYMIFTKLALTLVFILFFIPIICRFLFTQEQLETLSAETPGEGAVCNLPLNQACSIGYMNTWWDAIKWTVTTLPRNLWHIVKTTVPLMALAGLLGALLIVAVPWDVMVEWMPAPDVNELYIILAMIGLATIGTFLPRANHLRCDH